MRFLESIATLKELYGQRYLLDFTMEGPVGEVSVRICWIVRVGEDFPCLTDCYVL